MKSKSAMIVFPIIGGLITTAQAYFVWLTTFPSADNLIETIAAISFLKDREIYLYYPGQAHGGMLELPIQLMILNATSQNYLFAILPRVLFAGFCGYFLVRICLTLRTQDNHYWILFFLIFAPALLSQMWLQGGGYSSSWALQLYAISLLLTTLSAQKIIFVGLLMGLSFYQQPSSLLLSLLFAPFILQKNLINKKSVPLFLTGFFPVFLISISIRARITDIVYNPVTFAPSFNRIFGSLGLVNAGSENPSILHNTLGLMNGPDESTFIFRLLTAIGITLILILFVKYRANVTIKLLFTSFTLLLLGISVLVSFVGTSAWFYGVSACLFFPFALSVITNEIRNILQKVLIVVLIVTNFFRVPSHIEPMNILNINKLRISVNNQSDEIRNFSKILENNGVRFIYGDYWTVYPVMVSSKNSVLAIPENFNRFRKLITTNLKSESTSLIAVPLNQVEQLITKGNCKLVDTTLTYKLNEQEWKIMQCSTDQIKMLNG